MIPCPGCGAGLRFDIASQAMRCDYCDSTYDPYRFDADGTKVTLLKGGSRSLILSYLDRNSEILKDDALIKNYFDGWTWQQRGFLKDLSVKEEYFNPDNGPVVCRALYNRLICEAHCELVGNMTKMIFYGKLKHAEEWSEKLNQLKIDTIADKL